VVVDALHPPGSFGILVEAGLVSLRGLRRTATGTVGPARVVGALPEFGAGEEVAERRPAEDMRGARLRPQVTVLLLRGPDLAFEVGDPLLHGVAACRCRLLAAGQCQRRQEKRQSFDCDSSTHVRAPIPECPCVEDN